VIMDEFDKEDLERIRTVRTKYNGNVVLIYPKQDTDEQASVMARKAIKQHLKQQRSVK